MDEIFIFRYLVMPEHQLIEKNENITKRYFFDFMCFWTGLIYVSQLLKTYFTNEKIWETFRLCEACGINTAIVRTAADTIKVMNKYWKLGGKIQWLAQTCPKDDDVISNSQWAIDSGASAVYIQGNIADRWLSAGRLDLGIVMK
ncbi:MAG: hypothetical protein L3J11_00195 [Draconibacterium sp.]|nr:hypothetical protein [Draconibacterium sp.]